jgi:hypothetical protein
MKTEKGPGIGASILMALLLGGTGSLTAGPITYNFQVIAFPGASYTEALGINDSGDVVGQYEIGGVCCYGYVLSAGQFTSILVGGIYTDAQGISNAGDVVGEYLSYSQNAGSSSNSFLYGASGIATLDYPGALNSVAHGINSQGDIVGAYNSVGGNGPEQGYLDEGGVFTTIDVPGALSAQVSGINDYSEMVGEYQNGSTTDGFVDSSGVFSTIVFPGSDQTLVNGVNDEGEIVGNYLDSSGQDHGFIGSGTTFSTLDFPGPSLTSIAGINNSGQISGEFQDSAGNIYGFIGTPTPEPGGLAVFGLIAIALMALIWRSGAARRAFPLALQDEQMNEENSKAGAR